MESDPIEKQEELEEQAEGGSCEAGVEEEAPSCSVSDAEEESECDTKSLIDVSISADASLRLRQFALNELVSSEEDYVQDLGLVINGYLVEIEKKEIPIPEALTEDKMKLVFKNIRHIYEWHKETFLKVLQKCVDNPMELEIILKRCERKLHMYVIYCQNKPFSEHLVQEHGQYFDAIAKKLNHKLLLNDILIKPVQRIMKYELLIKDIHKHTLRAGLVEEAASLEQALKIIKIVPKQVNDLMVLRRLHNCGTIIQQHDKLLMHGTMNCAEYNRLTMRKNSTIPQPKKLQVFLFSQVIIFANIIGKKTHFSDAEYSYRNHLQVNLMSIDEDAVGPRSFMLKSTDEKRSDVSFNCTAPTQEKCKEWVDAIKEQLNQLSSIIGALENPTGFKLLEPLTARSSVP